MKIRTIIGLALVSAALAVPAFASAQRVVSPRSNGGAYGAGGYHRGYGHNGGVVGPLRFGNTTAYLSGGGYGYRNTPRVYYYQAPAFAYGRYYGFPQYYGGYRNYGFGSYFGY